MAEEDIIEVSAPSVDEAIIMGLTRLTAMRNEVDIEVLDEGNKGFLGLGNREARVRLTRRPEGAVPEPAAPQAAAARSPEPQIPAKAEPEALVGIPEREPKVAREPEAVAVPTPRERAHRPSSSVDDLDRDVVEAAASDVMQHLLPGLTLEIETKWLDEDRPTLWVSVTGRDANSLVGPRARNLHSLQYLFRALIYKLADGNYNVVVDADGYRRRRRRSLESLARRKADEAVAQGRSVKLRAMPAHERRIIHIVLKEDDRVSTESSGKGRDRAVTIVLGSKSSGNRS